jgi:RNA polymerase sigma-70 factor (ECF subfamily)
VSLDLQSPAGAALIVRAALGDDVAIDRLLRAVQQPLYDHVAFIVRDADTASDVLQDVLLAICRSLIQLNDPSLFRAWAFRIATRAAVRAARRANRVEHVSIDEIAESTAEVADDELFEPELIAALPALVNELPAACGIVVRLRYLDQLSVLEVAEALDLPAGTVKSRASYGVGLLRQRLRPTLREPNVSR